MNQNYILSRIAPCGLHCGKCFAFVDGDIKKQSEALKQSLGSFEAYAARFVELLDEPLFKDYDHFKNLLTHFSEANCGGCRVEHCKLFKDCNVRACSAEKEVDFCYQCKEFPCKNTGFDEHLFQRSININLRIKEIGIEDYYQEIKDKSRYET